MKADYKNIPRMLAFVLRSAPGSYLEMVLYGLLNCLAAVANVWVIQKLFGLAEEGYSVGLLKTLVLYGFLLLLSAGYSVWYIRYRVQFSVILDYEAAVRAKLHARSQRISNEVLETPDACAWICQADNAKQNLFRYGEIWISIGMAMLQALAVTGYLASVQPWFFLLLPLAVIPVALEALDSARLWRLDFEASAQCLKEERAYEQAMTDPSGCKETRLTDRTMLLLEKWTQSRQRRKALEEKQSRKGFLLHMGLLPVQILGSVGGFLVSALLLYSGEIPFAGFTAGIAAYSNLTAAMQSLVGSFGDELQWRNLIAPFFWYWEIPQRTGDREVHTLEREIRLEHVSFRYAGQEHNAIDDLSLAIPKGQVVAIVGENGAGKTTLVNLLLGLYLPSQGQVLYDGIPTAHLREEELHRMHSGVMQNFARYKLSVADNIRIGDFEKEDDVEKELSRIFGGTDVNGDTKLGKEFGGRELSGGQWQQLSCARGFWKDSVLLVLDEATSAIDPIREQAMYQRFRREMAGKTGILVTHRLGAVSMADRILVLSQGRIVQDGTHEALLARKGIYADLWESQAGAYA